MELSPLEQNASDSFKYLMPLACFGFDLKITCETCELYIKNGFAVYGKYPPLLLI